VPYNRIERRVAALLDSFPAARRFAKAGYQRLNYLLQGQSDRKLRLHAGAVLQRLPGLDHRQECFFGYFGECPWSRDGNFFLFHQWDQRRDAVDLEGGGEGVPRVDLGLGDDLLASLARVSTAYRARERAITLVVGNPELARAALRRALARGALGLAVVGGVLWLHALMARGSATIAYLHAWCDKGALGACVAEADRLEQQGDTARALSIHERMCDAFNTKSCVAAAERRESEDALDPKAIGLRRKACDGADAASCRILADRLLVSKGGNESNVAWLRKRAMWAR